MTLVGVIPYALFAYIVYLCFNRKKINEWTILLAFHMVTSILITTIYFVITQLPSIGYNEIKHIILLSMIWPFLVPLMIWSSVVLMYGIVWSVVGVLLILCLEISLYYGLYKIALRIKGKWV